jgi:HNH/Endo VII superfamily nuclease toxin with a HHH motif
MEKTNPEYFDAANAAKIRAGRSPLVNDTWVKTFPEHQGFLGDKLVHHHIDQGPIATPIPETIHQQCYKALHPNQGVVTMNFELLRSALLDAAPSEEALKALGISNEEAEGLISSFRILQRKEEVMTAEQSDVIGDFFSLYNPSNLEIGMIRFSALPKITDSGRVIGQVEADPLVVDKFTGKVYVDDLTSPGNTLWDCADSAEHFLSALIPAARYLGQCLVDDSIRCNKALLNQMLEECTVNAGGDRYATFYRMLLGAE